MSAEQVALASRQMQEHGVADRVAAHRGDIRDLPFETGSFDGVCCPGGPLSPVLDSNDREAVVTELARITVPGAPIVVSVNGLLNALCNGIRHGLDVHPDIFQKIARTGDYTAERVEERGGEGGPNTISSGQQNSKPSSKKLESLSKDWSVSRDQPPQ